MDGNNDFSRLVWIVRVSAKLHNYTPPLLVSSYERPLPFVTGQADGIVPSS